jgi:purine nucleosidase
MSTAPRRVLIDTDTAGDDAQALLLAATSDRLDIEGVTICAGNVAFDRQVENAKYALDLVDDDTTVYEGARSPLLKDHEFAEQIHGEGGLGGDLFPETGIDSGEEYAVDYIVETVRANPGEITLVCLAPLTNIALALKKEPALNELVDEVYVMGGAVHWPGNDTASAEFNFWVDPDAAKIVLEQLDVTLFDWGLSVRDTAFESDFFSTLREEDDTALADFYLECTKVGRAYNLDQRGGERIVQPDSSVVAALVEPDLVEETSQAYVTVDEREGITRGHTVVDTGEWELGEPQTTVVEALDGDLFERMMRSLLLDGTPDDAL